MGLESESEDGTFLSAVVQFGTEAGVGGGETMGEVGAGVVFSEIRGDGIATAGRPTTGGSAVR